MAAVGRFYGLSYDLSNQTSWKLEASLAIHKSYAHSKKFGGLVLPVLQWQALAYTITIVVKFLL